jgi:putative ABC transport system permease protein
MNSTPVDHLMSSRASFRPLEKVERLATAAAQAASAALPQPALFTTRLFRKQRPTPSLEARLQTSLTALGLAVLSTAVLYAVCMFLVKGVVLWLEQANRLRSVVYMFADSKKMPAEVQPDDLLIFETVATLLLVYLGGFFIPKWYDQIGEDVFGPFKALMRWRAWLVGMAGRAVGMIMLLGLSLLPLSSLLLVFPAAYPQESILSDSVRPSRSRWRLFAQRLFAAVTGIVLFVVLLAFAVEIVTSLGLKKPYFGKLARMALPDDLVNGLPRAMVEQWPYVLVIVYAADLLLLFCIGKVPLTYNVRNLAVRWRITVLTGLAFTVVLGLLTMMLSFVNGLNNLTSNSGIPGNVFVLSEAATDELFSSLYKGDVLKLVNEYTSVDENGKRLPAPVGIKEVSIPGPEGKVKLCSYETYYVLNHPVPVGPGEKPRRRFVQLRGIEDAFVAAKVHNIVLLDGGDWFGRQGAVAVGSREAQETAAPAVLGEGAAAKFAEDMHVPRLRVGDRFKLVDEDMVVSGIMKSEGSTFGSEVWVTWDWASKHFNKDQYTTIVLRASDDSEAGARALAKHLSMSFTNPRLRAVDEPSYYEDLGKSNDQMLSSVILVAIIMAIGGVFGVMNTMFAAIAQRTKDIGVLRILGFKRWQILVSFMLESLGIAILGGALGIALGSLCDGFQMTSNVSAGQGSGKTVIMKLAFDADIVICGLLFTIVMGRVGGLVPALSAMRLGILDSLK